MSSTSPDVLYSLFPISLFGAACLGLVACSAPLDGEPFAETTSVTTNAYARADGGSVAPPVTTPPALTDRQTGDGSMGKNSCDVCVTADGGVFFVPAPPSFAITPPPRGQDE